MNPQGANQAEAKPPIGISEPMQSPALRRFNFVFVYFPVALAVLATLSILVWLTIIGLNIEDVASRQNLSALADIVFVIFIMPAAVVCGLLPLTLLFLGIQIRRRDISISRSLVKVLQRTRRALAAADLRLSTVSKTAIRPLIFLHAVGAFSGTLAKAALRRLERR